MCFQKYVTTNTLLSDLLPLSVSVRLRDLAHVVPPLRLVLGALSVRQGTFAWVHKS